MKYEDAVRQLRKKMILSQVEFAKEIGVSYPTVARWETSAFKPSIRCLKKLKPYFDKYGIDMEELE